MNKKEICFLYEILYALQNGMWMKAITAHENEVSCFYCLPHELELIYNAKIYNANNKLGLSVNNVRELFFNSYNHKWSIDKNKLLGVKYGN